MKKKALSNKLKLQKENIVNLNQLNLIKGGIKKPTDLVTYTCTVGGTNTTARETKNCFAFSKC